ncbi:MAG: rhamnulokinase family protein [Candidatus Promineifilaceae bacterium]|nr:rhamnulokinase family protein [Candidatus Promineifilaceae bacterium]
MSQKTVLAVDLGAGSGRVMAVHFDGSKMDLLELHRFPNDPVNIRGTLYWNFLRLWSEIQHGIEKGFEFDPSGIGVDTWGVDFALLDRNGRLLENPICYRDDRTEGMMEAVFDKIPRAEIFARTGIQFMRINTLYQMMSLAESNSPLLQVAETFLMAPDLINYWLTGNKLGEFTIASTSQMLDAQTGSWARDLMKKLAIPEQMMPEIVFPGTGLGSYQNVPVIAPAAHDTGSAVAAVPTNSKNYAYISSGTWSLIGLEVEKPIVSDAALEANVTNEGGVYGTYRLLKNQTGLWILQQCRAVWEREGHSYSYDQLVHMARSAPAHQSIIDVNDANFLPPGNHVQNVRDYCVRTKQQVPESPGAIVRVVLESMALAYRYTLERLIAVSSQSVDIIHMVGGGIQNELLNQMTANATGRQVIAGPIEATVVGNALVQLIALGEISNIQDGRQLVAGMDSWKSYEPQESAIWEEAYQRYLNLLDGITGEQS